MDFNEIYHKQLTLEGMRKDAKRKARGIISDRFFTLAAGTLTGFGFCLGIFYSFRLLAFVLTAADINLDYLFGVLVYFICFPVILGVTEFCRCFLLTGKADFYIIFKSYYNLSSFLLYAEYSLLCLVVLLFLLFPFLLVTAIPYLFGAKEKTILVFEVISLFLLVYGVIYWLSFVFSKKLKSDYAGFYLSFLGHFIIAVLTRGLYLLFLFPYLCLSFFKFVENYKSSNKRKGKRKGKKFKATPTPESGNSDSSR